MLVDALMVQDEMLDLYDPDLRNALEAMLVTFRSSPRTTQQSLEPIDGVVYRSDLFGLLTKYGVNPSYHWFIMRLNNFFSPYEFNEGTTTLLMPNTSDLKAVTQIWKTSRVLST